MKLGILFSGGKDSSYAAFVAKQQGHELVCLMTIHSKNKYSYMFHTPSIKKTKEQAKAMNIPLIIGKTKGEKELELADLENLISKAIKKYKIEGIITGALHSDYQATRIQKICDKLKIKCINPLWHKNEIEYLKELIKSKFKIIIIGVAAYPLDSSWLGRRIDEKLIEEVSKLKDKYNIHPAGEGGEFESFVLDCPLFSKPLKVKKSKITGKDNAWQMEIEVI
ncbi:MAG TPA: diphthine--ammonia ligase [Candidatus Nanoarchaeia archaeon]|nr:diphthine--ammonia ligase [Candidatus Nanoarchaeia archaeon]